MTTRETILRSWWAARRQADTNGAVTLTAARTRDALEQVALEERRPVPSALAATGTGR